MEIKIYSQSGTLKATVSPGSGGRCVKELQGDSVLNLSFDYFEYVALDVNDYVDFCGDRYWLLEQYRPKEVSSVEWKYDVSFYGIESLIKRYLVIEHTDGDTNPVFTLTAPASQHMQMIVECLNNATGTQEWHVGTVVSTGNITVDYTGKYCDEGLRELAEKTGVEYWFSGNNGNTVNLSKCERGDLLEMSYGDGLISLERDVADNAKFYTRLYPVGSARNIGSDYGFKRLQLPEVNGVRPKCVDLEVEKYGVVDHYEQDAFSDIYPKYTGTVSSVRVETRTDEDGEEFQVYFFRDSGLPFDPNDHLLPDESMRVSFQSGDLQGLGESDDHYFEVNYDSETGEFEIINIWTDGQQLPGGNLVPAVGNTYIPWNISMPESYYLEAEQALKTAVDDYNSSHFADNSLYRGTTDHVWIEADPDNDRDEVELYIGRRIRLISTEYFPVDGYRDSRITKISRRIDLPSQMDLEISDAVSTGTLTKINDEFNYVREYARGLEAGFSDSAFLNLLTRYGSMMFLSKTHGDTAQGLIRFIKGLQVGEDFTSGPLGEGGIFRKDADGKTYIEADKLYVRMKAYFDTVEIRRFLHSEGDRIASSAGMKCCRVEWLNDSGTVLEQTDGNLSSVKIFRCYFRGEDDEDTVTNDFLPGDLAYCHITNAVSTSSLYQHHFWRLIVGKSDSTNSDGEHYIDLSNAHNNDGTPKMVPFTYEGQGGTQQTMQALSFQSGSDIPVAQDDIIQLGSVNDGTRRGAIIEYVSGGDSPSYQIYQDLGSNASNPYNLENKNYISLGYKSDTGRAYMNVYGDFFFGAKPENGESSTYIRYNAETHELNIKAVIEGSSPISGTNTTIDGALTELWNGIGDLQNQIDGSVETWFENYMPVAKTQEGAPANRVPLVTITIDGQTVPCQPYYNWYMADHGGQTTEVNTERLKHLGDVFYDNESGYAFRFSQNDSTHAFEWVEITDAAVVKALRDAAEAYGLADSKNKIFTTVAGQLPPYPWKEGDLWVNATYPADGSTYSNDILKCTHSRTSGGSISDWVLASKYTDDTKVERYTNILTGVTEPSESSQKEIALATENAIRTALGGNFIIEGGLMLMSIIGMRRLNDGGDPSDPDDYTTWAGISGVYDDNLYGGGLAAWFGGSMVDKRNPTTGVYDVVNGAKTGFRFDGSGWLADGNINWNSAGSMVIKNLTTIYGTNDSTGISINELSALTSIFHTETYGSGNITELLIKPQNAYSQLFINRSGNPLPASSYPQDHTINEYSVLNYGEMKARFVPLEFFNALFTAYSDANHTNAINPWTWTDTAAASRATINNLKILVGTWTEQYLSAYGLNSSGGGGGGSSTLEGLTDTAIASPSDGQVLVYDGLSHKWVNGAAQSGGGIISISMSVPTGFSVSPSTISNNGGTFAITFASGYALPTTAKQVEWDAAYGWGDHSEVGYLTDQSSTITTMQNDVTTLRGYFTNGVANVADKLDTGNTSYTAWGRQFWTNGKPTSVSGKIENASHIEINNNAKIYWKTSPSSATLSEQYISILTLDVSNNFVVGESMRSNGLKTRVRGKQVYLQSGTSDNDEHVATLDENGMLTVEKLKIGDIVIEYSSQNSGLHIVNAGVYADTYFSAYGIGSGGGGGSVSLNQPLSGINSAGLGAPSAAGSAIVWNGSSWTYSSNSNLRVASLSSLGSITVYSNVTSQYGGFAVSGKNDNYILTAGGGTKLFKLAIDSTSLEDGQALVYDESTSSWVNGAGGTSYTLPLAASGTRGGVQIGYTTDVTNRNYAVKLSSEKMYVNVPWEDTKNTAGGDQNSSLLYLVGMPSQTTGNGSARTYTKSTCYIGTDNCLYSNGAKVLTSEQYQGTVTSVKVGTTSYSPSSGVVSLPAYPTNTDTLNTAGGDQNSSLLYLVGMPSQTTGNGSARTYTKSTCYIGTDNCLYSNGSKVLTSITSSLVTGALGYTPANSSDLSNYLPKTGGQLSGALAITSGGLTLANGNVSVVGNVTANKFTLNGGTSSQFLKADGSVDSNVYIQHKEVGQDGLVGYSGSFFFGGSGTLASGEDYVGFQAGNSVDRWQMAYLQGNIKWRENDGANTPTTGWTSWRTVIDSGNVSSYIPDTSNFVDITSNQNVGGIKNFTTKVGMGTADPKKRLHVIGGIRADRPDSDSEGGGFQSVYGSKVASVGCNPSGGLVLANGTVNTSDGSVSLTTCAIFSASNVTDPYMSVKPNTRIYQTSGSSSLYLGRSDNAGWVYLQDCASAASTSNWALRTNGDARFLWVGINGNNTSYRLYVNGTSLHTDQIYLNAGKGISCVGSKATYEMIKFLDNTNDTYGQGIVLGGGGLTIIGGGESASTAAQALGLTNGNSEQMLICNDGNIEFYPNMQNGWNSKVSFIMTAGGAFGINTASPSYNLHVNGTSYLGGNTTAAGYIYPSQNTAFSLGSSSLRWSTVFCNSVNASSNSTFSGNVTVGSMTLSKSGNDHTIAASYKVTMSVGTLYVSASSFTGNVPYTGGSDIRKKNIIDMVDCDIDDIARAPIFDFTWKYDAGGRVFLGSSANYWQDVFPHAVTADSEGYLSQDYAGIALASAVITARKVLDHERRIRLLVVENQALRKEIEELKKVA